MTASPFLFDKITLKPEIHRTELPSLPSKVHHPPKNPLAKATDLAMIRVMTLHKIKSQGFTLIELMMIILLVGILMAVAIPQFFDFSTEAKTRALRESLAVVRTGISVQYAQLKIRCGVTSNSWPDFTQLQSNDITAGTGAQCSTTEVSKAQDRRFWAGNTGAGTIPPDNPWSGSTAASTTAITACSGMGCTNKAVDCAGAARDTGDGGWCYSETTGEIWANSDNSGSNEYKF